MSAGKPRETKQDTTAEPEADGQQPSGLTITDEHRKMLVEGSAIDPEVIAERGYYSLQTKKDLKRKGFSEGQQDTVSPRENELGLVMPICWPGGATPFYVFRPDSPRPNRKNPKKLNKYEMPTGCKMALDSPPRCHADLGNPNIPLFETEGQKKGDALASYGLCALSLIGVWNWRGTNEHGGKTVLPEWEDVALNGRKDYMIFDSDIIEKREVYDALVRHRDWLKKRGADVWIIHLPPGPNGEKVGVDDWFAQDPNRTVQDLLNLASKELVKPARARRVEPERKSLADVLLPDAPVPESLSVPLGYEVGSGGVVKVDVVGEDENMRERKTEVSPRPIYIVGIVESMDGEGHHLVLVSRYRDKWIRTVASREQVMDARKLVALANEGLPVASGRAGLVSEYLDAFESANLDRLPCAQVSAQMSWMPGGEYMIGQESIEMKEEA